MKVTKAIYLRHDIHHVTEKEVLDSLYLRDELAEELTPDNWTKIKVIEIDVPESLINDIISSNENDYISKKIAEHEAAIADLEELRNTKK